LLLFDNATHRYRLGPLVFQMGLASGEMFFRDAAAPVLSGIAEETGDTVFLMMRCGYDSLCVDRREGAYPVKTFVVEVGTRRPLGMGAAALAMLAALSDDEVGNALAANESRLQAFPGMTVDVVRQMVRRTRAQRYSSMNVIGVPGVRAVGYPVLLLDGSVAAAISIAAIEHRVSPEREKLFATLLKNAARNIVACFNRGLPVTPPVPEPFG